jgi:hypothetical protein
MSKLWWKMYIDLHVKYSLILSDFNETLIFWTDFRKMLKYQISWKSVQWKENCSVRTDEQTDITEAIVAFRNFAKAPKNCSAHQNKITKCIKTLVLSFFFTSSSKQLSNKFLIILGIFEPLNTSVWSRPFQFRTRVQISLRCNGFN